MKSRLWLAVVAVLVLVQGAAVLGEAARGQAAQDQLDFADGLYARGMYRLAVQEYDKFIRESPADRDSALVLYRTGECFHMLEDYKAARARYEDLLSRHASSAHGGAAGFRLGEIHFRLGEYDEAVRVLGKVLERSPDAELEAGARYYLARARLASGDRGAALAAYEKLVSLPLQSSFAVHGHLELAGLYREMGKPGKALAQLEMAVGKAGGAADPGPRMQLADALLASGHHERAAEFYRKLRDGKPNGYRAKAAMGLARSLYRARRYEDAAREAAVVAERFPGSDSASRARYLEALSHYARGDGKRAISLFLDFLKRYPDDPAAVAARYRIAWCRYMLGEFKQAGAEAEVLLRGVEAGTTPGGTGTVPNGTGTAPGGAEFVAQDCVFLIGECAYRTSRYGEAMKRYQEVVSAGKGEFPEKAAGRIGYCLFHLGKYGEARRSLSGFVSKYPASSMAPAALLKAGESAWMLEDTVGALEEYRRLVSGYPRAPELETALYHEGLCLVRLKRHEEAAAAYGKLLERFPGTGFAGEARYWLGWDAARRKDYARARKEFEDLVSERGMSDPLGSRARWQLAAVTYQLKDYTRCAALVQELIDSGAGGELMPEMALWLGGYLSERKDYAGAARVYDWLMSKELDESFAAEALYRSGECSRLTGAGGKARKSFERLARDYPDSGLLPHAHLGLGRVYVAEGLHRKAIPHYEKALAMAEPGEAVEVHFLLGEAHREVGDAIEAARAFMRLAILFDDPEFSPRALWEAGLAWEKAGRPAEMKRAFSELSERYPGSTWAGRAAGRTPVKAEVVP